MSMVKFANILLETTERALNYPGLYCKATAPFLEGDDNQWILCGKGHYDFTTYYNALSVYKMKKYTRARDFFFHIELKGSAASITQTRGDALSHEPDEVPAVHVDVPASKEWQSIDLHLDFGNHDILLGFVIDTEGPVYIRNGYYSAEIEGELRPVNLAIVTTTFKKESYVIGNIDLIKKRIFADQDACNDIKQHLHMYVIDNGRTLDAESLSDTNITVVPNRNVGGSGGFTRGMIMAMEQNPEATHVLLMDDDVSVAPESIKRTYNILRMLNSEYRDAFLSGAMLNYNIGDMQTEDIGFMNKVGNPQPCKPRLRMTLFEDLVFNETFETLPDMKDHTYAGWWYCVIPMRQIKQHRLPLPFFVRCDDTEYGIRCNPKFMTMNGIGLWHQPFETRYDATVERYQTVRNDLIARFMTGFAPQSDVFGHMNDMVRLELKKFGYTNAELILDAFEDFLKGPDFFEQKNIAEETFLAANKHKEKLVPFDELLKQADSIPELGNFRISDLTRQIIDTDKPRHMYQRAHDYITSNEQRINATEGKGYAVIPSGGWIYPAGMIRGKRVLVLVDWYNHKGCIRVKDQERFKAIEKRYTQDLRYYKANKKRLQNEYSARFYKLTSVSYWKDYLDMK